MLLLSMCLKNVKVRLERRRLLEGYSISFITGEEAA